MAFGARDFAQMPLMLVVYLGMETSGMWYKSITAVKYTLLHYVPHFIKHVLISYYTASNDIGLDKTNSYLAHKAPSLHITVLLFLHKRSVLG